MSRSCPAQTERALAAWAFYAKAANCLISPFSVYAGQSGEVVATPAFGFNLIGETAEIQPPDIIFRAFDLVPVAYGALIHEGQLEVTVETQIDTSMTNVAEDLHHQFIAAWRCLLEDFDTLSAAVNAPASGPDLRPVKDFTLSALVYQPEEQSMEDRRLVTVIPYYICSAPAG